jgi:curli biogenesis system outer membrane secretion channel CsgG/TolA-binding protein
MKKLKLVILFAFFVCALSAPSEAADRIRMGMIKFESKAAGVSDRQAEIITDIFTNVLHGAKSIAVMERAEIESIGAELKLQMSGLVDPATAVQIGKIKGLQYMVMGAVTELSKKGSGGAVPLFVIPGSVGGGSVTASAKVDVRIVDVETSEVVMAVSEVGMSKNSAQAFNLYGVRWGEAEFGGLEARAIADASLRLAHKIKEKMGGEYSYVLSGSGNELIVDEGNSMGVQDGDSATLFLVYADGTAIMGMDNRALSREKIPLGVLKVKKAESDYSTCVVAPPTKGNLIRRGDKIEPISTEEAKTVKSPSSRPAAAAASSETFQEIFGDGNGGGQPEQKTQPSAQEQSAPAQQEQFAQLPQPGQREPETQPEQPAASGSFQWRDVDGVDPNSTTDAKLIDIYPLSSQERNTIGIKHRGAWKMYSGKRYKEAFEVFSQLVLDYDCNYLAAYWAGMAAQKLGSAKEAAAWFERALAINPNYQPAIDGKAKLGGNPVNKPVKTRR